jgi:archaeosortase A
MRQPRGASLLSDIPLPKLKILPKTKIFRYGSIPGTFPPMSDLVIYAAFLAFALFFVAGSFRKYAAIAGWACIVLNLLLELPAFFAEANFFYPTLALLSLPFLAITVRYLLREDPVALRLSTTAAVAVIIFVPFALDPFLRDNLISVTVNLAFLIITSLGHHPAMYTWDVMVENGFYNQIILGCTGILAIALMTGVIAGVEGISLRQRLGVLIDIIPLIFVLNLLRVSVVFIAVSDRWFAHFPDPTGTGDANFFWAHNVIAEGLAVLFLLLLIAGLCRILPGLREYALDVVRMYRDGVIGFVGR